MSPFRKESIKNLEQMEERLRHLEEAKLKQLGAKAYPYTHYPLLIELAFEGIEYRRMKGQAPAQETWVDLSELANERSSGAI